MKLSHKTSWIGFLFCLPLTLGVLVVYGTPFCITLLRSIQQSLSDSTFTLTHYRDLFTNSAFQLATRNTSLFWLIALPCNVLLGLALAFACNHSLGKRFKPILAFSAMIPAACSVLLLQALFPETLYHTMITSTTLSPLLIITLFLWKYVGYSVLILSAALYTIPKELLESATQCGATNWQVFTHIQLPLLQAPLAVSFLFAFLNSFKLFREVYLIGGAHPNSALYSLQHFLSNNFSNMNFSRLAATSILVIMVVCALLGFVWVILKQSDGSLS